VSGKISTVGFATGSVSSSTWENRRDRENDRSRRRGHGAGDGLWPERRERRVEDDAWTAGWTAEVVAVSRSPIERWTGADDIKALKLVNVGQSSAQITTSSLKREPAEVMPVANQDTRRQRQGRQPSTGEVGK